VKQSYINDPSLLKLRSENILSRMDTMMKSLYSCTCINSNGEKFRSKLEVEFSEILIKHNINYKYEKTLKLINKRNKYIDFVIDDFIYIEITGFAYTKWKEDFKKSMRLVRKSCKYTDHLLFISYPENYHKLFKLAAECEINTYTSSIDDHERILNIIEMCRSCNQINNIYNKQKENV